MGLEQLAEALEEGQGARRHEPRRDGDPDGRGSAMGCAEDPLSATVHASFLPCHHVPPLAFEVAFEVAYYFYSGTGKMSLIQ